VGPSFVVVVDEFVDEGLELVDGRGLTGMGPQALLHGLLESFDLAAGGRMVRPGVLLPHAQTVKLCFESVAPALPPGQSRREDHAIVRQRRGWNPMDGNGFPEAAEDGPSRDPPMSRDRQSLAGVVIQPGEDLHMGTGGTRRRHEPIVGEVGLPALVGLIGLEANRGRTWFHLGLRGNQAGLGQIAADGGARHPDSVVVFEVPPDGVRSGIKAGRHQRRAEFDDLTNHCRRHSVGRGVWPSGSGFEGRLSLGAIPSHQLGDPSR
jgi:hypothetical protein